MVEEKKRKGRRKGEKGKRGQAPIPSRDLVIEFIDRCADHRHPARNQAIMTVFFSLGLRPKEASKLKLGDVYDFDRDELRDDLFLDKEYTKRAKTRILPMTGSMLKKYLLPYILERKNAGRRFRPDQALFLSQKGGHFSPNSLGNLMNDFLEKRFEFRRGSSYSARRFFATTMYRNEVGLKTIQELMGHASISTTQIYTVPSEEQKQDAVRGVL
ncbi:tyrosine recombinase XerC [Vibrio maritimus]|uniref:Tyrosine recombinase XerC n=1 Tax=Vibrio maritimus TaxID=990268 RepID=A0A090S5L1_9VIBR|nr:tyrosine recombinase XerC [Vibrio maritimus]